MVTCQRTGRRAFAGRLRALRAFTLIEMLTVIAIIAILAGILIPATRMVMRRARMHKTRADIRAIEMAISAYMQDFGAPPPDSNESLADEFSDMDTPNECLIWFLTREYRKSLTATTDFTGQDPEDVDVVYARERHDPYHSIPGKAKKDLDEDGFYQHHDAWGRPFLYRAYVEREIDRITRPGGDTSRVYVRGGTAPGGEVDIEGTGSNNGTFDVTDTGVTGGESWFEIDNSGGSAETPAPDDAVVIMADLHNENKGFDLYSVGPNGKTRVSANELVSPFGAEETSEVWGAWEDGNDVPPDQNGNPGIEDERDVDDISNWAQ